MDSKPKIEIGTAILLFVLVDALFRISGAVWEAVGNVKRVSRLFLFNTNDIFRNGTALGVGVIIIAVFSVLIALLLVSLFVQVWSDAIKLIRVIVIFHLPEKENDYEGPKRPDPAIARKEMMNSLFGNNIQNVPSPIVWRLLRNLMKIYLLIIVAELISSFIPVP